MTPPGGPPPLAFLAVPIGTLLVFAILVGAGLAQRRRSETHKRLMLLATIAILTPAIARLRWTGARRASRRHRRHLPVRGGVPGHDRVAHGRVHPAFLWGGLFVMVALPLRFALGGPTRGWSVARWMTE